jgi:hypothetical protein
MRTTTALLVLLALTLPAVAMPHPCEAEVAQMRKDLDAIRGAVATIEGLRPSDNQRQVLAGAKGKYDLEQRGTGPGGESGRQGSGGLRSGFERGAPGARAGSPGPGIRSSGVGRGGAGNPVPHRLRQGHRLQGSPHLRERRLPGPALAVTVRSCGDRCHESTRRARRPVAEGPPSRVGSPRDQGDA